MADYEDGIFSNLPQRRRRADADNTRSFFREALGMYVPEGPLPPRPHPSGKGGPSLGVSNAPPTGSASPVVTGTAAVGQTLTCSQGTWFNSPTSYAYQWLRDGANIAGATASTYVVVAGDLGHSISCTVTATNSFGSTPATSNAVLIVALPANTVAPAITGTATVGSTLSCSQGTWTNSPTSYTYQWMGNGVNISGATSSSYVVVTGDAGTSIRCTVTATNATASGTATSNALAIAALPSAPSNTVAPAVTGTATVGSTLSCSQGTWTNSPTGYAYQWQRNGVDTSGATASSYVTVTADGGTSVSCRVTASNAAGGASQVSNSLAIAAGGATSVWSAADAAAGSMTLTNGGLTATFTGTPSIYRPLRGSISHTSGKVYIEFLCLATGTADNYGVASSSINLSFQLGTSNYSSAVTYGVNQVSSGFTSNYTTNQFANAGDVIMMAVDFAGSLWIGMNNVWAGGGNPATGTLPIISFVPATVGALFPAMSFGGVNDSFTLQPTPASQKYLPPPGFQAWDGGPVTPPASSVWSAADATAGSMTLSNGGLTVAGSGSGNWSTVRGSISQSSGKLYAELAVSGTITGDNRMFGLANAGFSIVAGNYLGSANYSVGLQSVSGSHSASSGFATTAAGNSFPGIALVANDVLQIAIDFTAQVIWFGKNNAWFTGSPSGGTLPFATFVAATVGALFPAMSLIGSGAGVWTLQPTAASQKYAPPSGFSAWG